MIWLHKLVDNQAESAAGWIVINWANILATKEVLYDPVFHHNHVTTMKNINSDELFMIFIVTIIPKTGNHMLV